MYVVRSFCCTKTQQRGKIVHCCLFIHPFRIFCVCLCCVCYMYRYSEMMVECCFCLCYVYFVGFFLFSSSSSSLMMKNEKMELNTAEYEKKCTTNRIYKKKKPKQNEKNIFIKFVFSFQHTISTYIFL